MMNTILNNNFNEINLEFTPHTKALLEIYTKALDEDLVVTNEYLKSELIRLQQTSNMLDLIIFEYMKSSYYDGQTEVSLEDVNLNYIPHTKHLLKQYLSNQFEGTIEPTLENLKEVLLDLYKHGKIGCLFDGEWIYSPIGLEPEKKLQFEFPNVELNNLKGQLREELQVLDKFISFQTHCFEFKHNEFLKSCKKYKYLNFDEEKNEVIFSDELLTSINIPSEIKYKETLYKLSEKIEKLEKHISELINEVLKIIGIQLPQDFRFTSDEY